MSHWTKAQQLPPEALQQIRNVYGEHFPIEVRHFLAPWIEEKLTTDIDPDNPQHENYIRELISSFIQEVETKANSIDGEDMFITKMKLLETTNLFKQRYSYNPNGLFRMIKHCLLTEMRLVQQSESSSNNQVDSKNAFSFANPTYVELHHNIDTLRGQTQEIVEIIKRLDSEQESFSLKFYEFQKNKDQLQQMQNSLEQQSQDHVFLANKLIQSKKALENLLQEKAKTLSNFQLHIVEKLKEEYRGVSALIRRMIDTELLSWKRNQQLAGNGCDFEIGHLDILQTWCENLAEITWANLTQTKEAKRLAGLVSQWIGESQSVTNGLHDLGNKFTELLSSLVTNTFILEKQPPQVMKTNTRFSAKVRLLVGGKLNVHMNPPVVKASIISEAQANYLLTEKTFKGEAVSGDILNNTGTMEYEQTSKQLSITFRNMQLKKIKRAEKKGSESVVDEKFSLFFSSKFLIGGELEYHVWTLSLPVAVIVHGNQEPHAWATITWDNAFAEPGRKPFVVPDRVSWNKVAQALNLKFGAVTGKALSKENMKYLAEKLFRAQSDDYDSLQLSWSQFSKESLADRNFTFWDWFYAIMKLTREHLKSLWVDGSIHGFVRKRQAEEMLSTCPSGTFLLRFSDSELGGITVAWVGGTGEQKEVIMLQPFTAKDFAIRSLADRLNDLSHLLYLYPDTPKEKAFGRYYTPFTDSQCTSSNGYVKPLLVTHVPGWGSRNPTSSGAQLSGALNSYPNTPHSMFHPGSPGDTASVMSEPGISYGGPNEVDYSELCGVDNTMDFHNIDMNFNGL